MQDMYDQMGINGIYAPETATDDRRLQSLFRKSTSELLSREFRLRTMDRAQIQRCVVSCNQLGFAPYLVILCFLHVRLYSLSTVPDAIGHLISLQLVFPAGVTLQTIVIKVTRLANTVVLNNDISVW